MSCVKSVSWYGERSINTAHAHRLLEQQLMVTSCEEKSKVPFAFYIQAEICATHWNIWVIFSRSSKEISLCLSSRQAYWFLEFHFVCYAVWKHFSLPHLFCSSAWKRWKYSVKQENSPGISARDALISHTCLLQCPLLEKHGDMKSILDLLPCQLKMTVWHIGIEVVRRQVFSLWFCYHFCREVLFVTAGSLTLGFICLILKWYDYNENRFWYDSIIHVQTGPYSNVTRFVLAHILDLSRVFFGLSDIEVGWRQWEVAYNTSKCCNLSS